MRNGCGESCGGGGLAQDGMTWRKVIIGKKACSLTLLRPLLSSLLIRSPIPSILSIQPIRRDTTLSLNIQQFNYSECIVKYISLLESLRDRVPWNHVITTFSSFFSAPWLWIYLPTFSSSTYILYIMYIDTTEQQHYKCLYPPPSPYPYKYEQRTETII